ncbi:DUF4434 domain-containing protein [Flexibacterium corallicola]|uniref:DUF4434 domain-containing protein n=1 Tax=Flexibacterium corallicola TaxID=3037259 RepID=UPI00286ED159|nr:DUF4434 domain-containing protein [Pseudovibrio sp. M1P-2-3]
MATETIEFWWALRPRFKIGVITLISLAFFLSSCLSAKEDPEPPRCFKVEYSFIQPWGDHYSDSYEQWVNEFEQHKNFGIDQIVLQWTLWGTQIHSSPPTPQWFPTALRAAKKTGVKLWVGLHYDPQFIIKLKGNRVRTYLAQRSRESTALAKALISQMEALAFPADNFAGWYLSDEVDSKLLTNDFYYLFLSQYFLEVRQNLQILRGVPVAVSAYTGGNGDKQNLAFLWNQFMTATGINVLFNQDGVGAKLQTLSQAGDYNLLLSNYATKYGWNIIPVVELFNIKKSSNQFQTVSASPRQVIERMNEVEQNRDNPVAVFSLSSHVLQSKSPYKAQLEDLFKDNTIICHDQLPM